MIDTNEALKGNIECRLQTDSDNIFTGIIREKEKFDFTLCNPPFHKSEEKASAGTRRKISNLTKNRGQKSRLNFGGQANELWCPGGEIAFIIKMIRQSTSYSKNCFWFSSLVSKKENLPVIYRVLKQVNAYEVHTIEMKQGQKRSRIVAWTFLTKKMQMQWSKERWLGEDNIL